MRIFKIKAKNQPKLVSIFERSGDVYKSVVPVVKKIIEKVKQDGDNALVKFTKEFDNVTLSNLEVTETEINDAYTKVTKDFLKAFRQAIRNQRKFQSTIMQTESTVTETQKGIKVWREARPIEKIGLYVPGGRARYPSCLVMVGVPAKLAGCRELIVCSPPDKTGNIPASTLVACNEVGVSKIYKVGGAQAVAAMAYGTETIEKVYKIFGAGNSYVTAAKMLVFGEVDIDLPAGPSEVMIVSDDSSNPDWIAADLIAQCEHGTESAGVLITNSLNFAKRVKASALIQAKNLASFETILTSLNNYGAAIVVSNWDEAIDLVNDYAPEHLEIATSNYLELKDKIINAGSVFLGKYSTEPAGDYVTGSNHILPTNGYAKMFSGLSIDAFQKQIEFQELTKEGLESVKFAIDEMAKEEGLPAHANACDIRFKL